MHLVSQYIEQFITGIIVMLVGGIAWLFRTVFTNQTEIALLTAEIKKRDITRAEDREILLSKICELKEEIKETKHKVDNLQTEMFELWKSK